MRRDRVGQPVRHPDPPRYTWTARSGHTGWTVTIWCDRKPIDTARFARTAVKAGVHAHGPDTRLMIAAMAWAERQCARRSTPTRRTRVA